MGHEPSGFAASASNTLEGETGCCGDDDDDNDDDDDCCERDE